MEKQLLRKEIEDLKKIKTDNIGTKRKRVEYAY